MICRFSLGDTEFRRDRPIGKMSSISDRKLYGSGRQNLFLVNLLLSPYIVFPSVESSRSFSFSLVLENTPRSMPSVLRNVSVRFPVFSQTKRMRGGEGGHPCDLRREEGQGEVDGSTQPTIVSSSLAGGEKRIVFFRNLDYFAWFEGLADVCPPT